MQQPDQRRKTTATIECPKSMVGRVIGKNGETIKALQTYTGSLIQVNQVDNPCQITISGSPQSLSLAVSMVADIVKGTFKGFALLRQVASPSMARSYASFPTHAQLPQPVYAPGYGLIPPSQLYGADDRVSTGSLGAGGGLTPQPGFTWTAGAAAQPMLLGLQPALSQHTFSSTAGILNGMAGSTTSLSMQPMFGGLSVTPANGTYGGIPYYHPQELGMSAGEAGYPDGSGAMYATAGPGMPHIAGLADGHMGASNGAKLMQAVGGPHSAHQLGRQPPSASAGWLPRGGGGAGGAGAGGYGSGSNAIVSGLLDTSNSGATGAPGGGAAGGVAGGAGTGGNLVVDADGKVYYVNTL